MNLKSGFLIRLDLDKLNYDAWHELFSTQCISYGVQYHLGVTKDKSNDLKWSQINVVVKIWLYGTLS